MTGAPQRLRRDRLLAFGAVVPACLAWIGLSVWGAGSPTAWSAQPRAGVEPIESAALSIALALALLCHAWFYSGVAPASVFAPLVLLAAVWTGLAVECHIDPSDAVAVLTATVAVTLLVHRPLAVGPIGVLTGTAVAVSPLLAGVGAGLCIALRADTRQTRRGTTGPPLRAFVIWMALGLASMTVVGVSIGRPPWMAAGIPEVLNRLGPAAVWLQLAGLLGLVAPVLVVGVLGLVVECSDAPGATESGGPVLPVYLAIRVWMLFNAVVALLLPKVCAGHGIVLLAPAGLLTALGWRSLRTLVSKPMPMTITLSGGVCLFLLAVLTWVPLRAAAAGVLVALLPP